MESQKRHGRQERLLRSVEVEGVCSIGALAERLGVSEETIRRDVRDLETQGKLQKLHGAVRLRDRNSETPFGERAGELHAVKVAIAKAAAELIPDNCSVFIDTGTTSLHVARALRGHRQLSVVTNAHDAAHELCSINGNRVYMAGGEIDHDRRAVFGVDTIAFLGQFVPDVAILSAAALDLKLGLMEFQVSAAMIKRHVATLARSVMLVADSTKFHRAGLVQSCPFDVVTTFVTDGPIPASFRQCFADAKIVELDLRLPPASRPPK